MAARLRAIRIALLAFTLAAVGANAAVMRDDNSPATAPATVSSTNTHAATSSAGLPTMADDGPRDLPGMHNVVAYHAGFYSGGVPEGNEAFDALAAMGVRTIISVDGAVPDVTAAKVRGIRYIHLPIGYNGFDETRKLELVRATRDAMADGNVYLHCHHGKHRSAGAAGAIAASLGWLTPEQAVDRMKVSGTAPNYTGLYACTANATVLDARTIDDVPANFPEVSQPATFVKSMVEIDEINDRLKLIEQAGWTAPGSHPDLVPVAEAGRMADLFRLLESTDKVKSQPEDFQHGMALNAQQAQMLEDLLTPAAGTALDTAKLSDIFKQIQATCKGCHAKHRD